MKQANIKVAVRIRPMLEDESKQGHSSSKLQVDSANHCIKYPLPLIFSVHMEKNNNNKSS